MRILHLAPLWFPVSRDSLGGIETFLAQLIPALERTGCQNALLASGDSRTRGELLTVVSPNLYTQMGADTALEYSYYEQHQFLIALRRASGFDLLHSHLGPRGLFLSGLPEVRVLHTWHTQVYVDMAWFVERHPGIWLSAVSEFQAQALRRAGAAHCAVIPNGIDTAAFPAGDDTGQGLLFLGRLEHAKGADLAIATARALDRPLTLAGPIIDREFFSAAIEPALDERIRYVGTVDHSAKIELMGRAACVVMPSRVAETFGVVAVEAMACGTPVVALANGALPEIVEPDITGYLTRDPEVLPDLVTAAVKLDREAIRARAVARFDVGVVAERYRALYAEILASPPSR